MSHLLDRLQSALGDRYAVQVEIGRGGMARVYLATDLKHDRQVAIKVLEPGIAALLGAERFDREIRFAARLNHPHIVPLLDSGELPSTLADGPGLLYYTMPYVEGESLRHRLDRERQLPLEDAIRTCMQVADALNEAHAHGIIHRDIKPENILLNGRHAQVTDFGIARAIDIALGTGVTVTGIAVGTPAYMSPEQASGSPVIDARTDVYSLGCVLYEMLAGEKWARMGRAPPSVHSVRESVPSGADVIINKATARAPADRYQSAAEMLDALETLLATDEVGIRVRRRPRVRRGALWTAAAMLGAAAIIWVAGGQIAGTDRLALPATSREARRALAAGARALDQWRLADAAEQFGMAARADPGLALAHLRRTEALWWLREPDAEWQREARLAAAAAPRLAGDDSIVAIGLGTLASGDYPASCAIFAALVSRDPASLAGHFGLGECQSRDSLVVRTADGALAFRGSWARAIDAYEQAVHLVARERGAFHAQAFARLDRLLFTEPTQVRSSGDLAAYPGIDHDTLSFVPVLREALLAAELHTKPAGFGDALERNRARRAQLARDVTRLLPGNAGALRALALSLETSGEIAYDRWGDNSAIALIRRARSVERDPAIRLDIGLDQVRMLLKTADFLAARALADTLLDGMPARPDAATAGTVQPLAALRGRITQSAALLMPLAEGFMFEGIRLPIEPTRTALALLNYSAFGAPAESIRVLAHRLQAQLASWEAPVRQEAALAVGLREPLSYAYRSVGTVAARIPDSSLSYLARMWRGVDQGRHQDVRRTLAALRQYRHDQRAGSLAMGAAVQEAYIHLAIGDSAGAIRLLDLPLNELATVGNSLWSSPVNAAGLPRAMALRATLADRKGDRATATRWANAVLQLWDGADPALTPVLDLMQEIVNRNAGER